MNAQTINNLANAKLLESLAGSGSGVLPSHFLLAQIFNTPIYKKRLCRALGCAIQEISKKLIGERGNPIRLVEKILDEALRIDSETGKTAYALKIAEHFINYYKSKVRELVDAETCNWHSEANAILREGTDVVLTLNSLEVDERDLPDLLAVEDEARELVHKTNLIRERVRLRIIEVTSGRLETKKAAQVTSSHRHLSTTKPFVGKQNDSVKKEYINERCNRQ